MRRELRRRPTLAPAAPSPRPPAPFLPAPHPPAPRLTGDGPESELSPSGRRLPGDCSAAEAWLPALAGGDVAGVPSEALAHAGCCLRCQAGVTRYRRMARELRSLEAERLVPPADALSRTLLALRDLEPARRPAAYVGGVVATAAGAAAGVGMLVWRSRRRAALAG